MSLDFKQFYYKRNRLQQLKGFYYTVQLGSITKAAKKMGLNQSTITLQIQSLERDLGVKVFERTKPLNLSKDGQTLYEMSFPLLQGIDNLYENFTKRNHKKKESKINIATHHIAISHLLPDYIKYYSSENPNVKIGIKNITSSEALRKIVQDDIDIAIYPNIEDSYEYYSYHFASFDPVLVMRRDHPLAKKKEVELSDIAQHNVVRIDKNLITLPLFEQAFEKFKFRTNIEFENGDWEMVKQFVRSDIGMGFISTICINNDDKDLTYKKLNKFFPKMDYKIIVKKGKPQTTAVKNFIKSFDKNFKFEFCETLNAN